MTDLRSFAVLQSRVYEFLAQQDEATLLAIVDGTAQLAALRADAAPRADADEPAQVVPELSSLNTKELKTMAKQAGLTGYSKLNRAELLALLVNHGHADPVDGDSAESSSTNHEAEPASPNVYAVAIAARLRETETEAEGAEYLHEQHLDRDGLLAVAGELRLTRVSRLSRSELEKRILKQAIGARRKFAGLRSW